MAKKFRDFESAREFTRKLGIKSKYDWKKYCESGNKPEDIPYSSDVIYKNKGWIGWGDFLGTGNKSPKHEKLQEFMDAKEFVRNLKFRNQKEWFAYCKSGKKPDDIPSNPNVAYKKEWLGYADWLGTKNITPSMVSREYLPFKEARDEARKLAKKYHIKNNIDWENAVKKELIPKNIPNRPREVYSKKRMRKKDGKK